MRHEQPVSQKDEGQDVMLTPITDEQFTERLNKLCETNPLANRIINGDENMDGCGFHGLAKHLQTDALKRMGLRAEVSDITGATSYFIAQEAA